MSKQLIIQFHNMKAVHIGKGMYRVTVRSKGKRERLAKIPEVCVDGDRVIFPEWLTGNIKLLLNPPAHKKKSRPVQTKLL